MINKGYLKTNTTLEKLQCGTSMMQPIPENRDCSGAGIPSHWCSCGSYVSTISRIPISDAGKQEKFLSTVLTAIPLMFEICVQSTKILL